MSSMATTRTEGSWEECNQKECNMIFFRFSFGHKCYSLSDKIGTCPLCVHQKKEQNGTLPKKDSDISQFVHHKSNDARPGSDTL